MCTLAGQIGYALAPMIARGAMFGSKQPVILHLLDVERASGLLEGVRMELLDGAFPLLSGTSVILVHTTHIEGACTPSMPLHQY